MFLGVVMDDSKTTIEELKKKVRTFRDERGWRKGWSARSFAISLVVEAVELLEHFQWRSGKDVFDDKEMKKEAAYELADVLYWVLAIADSAGLDLSRTFEEKLEKQSERYPAERFSKDLTKKEKLREYYRLKKEGKQ